MTSLRGFSSRWPMQRERGRRRPTGAYSAQRTVTAGSLSSASRTGSASSAGGVAGAHSTRRMTPGRMSSIVKSPLGLPKPRSHSATTAARRIRGSGSSISAAATSTPRGPCARHKAAMSTGAGGRPLGLPDWPGCHCDRRLARPRAPVLRVLAPDECMLSLMVRIIGCGGRISQAVHRYPAGRRAVVAAAPGARRATARRCR